MPVARIVTRHNVAQTEAVNELSEQLRAAGYEVEVAPPGTEGGAADLIVELDELPVGEALDAAVQMARQTNADLYIAPGLVAAPAARQEAPRPVVARVQQPQPPAEKPRGFNLGAEHDGVLGETFDELGAALAEGRVGIRETVSGMRGRVIEAWTLFRQHRAETAQALQLARERREVEREEQRRQHELELQRQAEEKQQLLAERERLAAEHERVLREQMARDAGIRAERERVEREAMAREAARRAEMARAEDQERRRRAAMEAERLRGLREQEAQRVAAMQAERTRLQREQEAQRVAALQAERIRLQRERETRRASAMEVERARLQREEEARHAAALLGPAAIPLPMPEALPMATMPALKPRGAYPRRRIPSPRERQWQRAAFVASVATLAAMLGFALAAKVRPGSPLPASLMQNSAQQQVPFGPAKVVPTKAPAPARPTAAPKATSAKPSPAKPMPRRRPRSAVRESDVVAEDEVIVRHAPSSRTQRAQSTATVRRYSDEN